MTTEDKLTNTHFPWEVKRLACALWFVSGTLPCVASHFSLTFPVLAQAEEYCCSLSLQCFLRLPQRAPTLHLHHPNYFSLFFFVPWKLQPIFYHALKPTYDLETSYHRPLLAMVVARQGDFQLHSQQTASLQQWGKHSTCWPRMVSRDYAQGGQHSAVLSCVWRQ